jgi:hypothetical protein
MNKWARIGQAGGLEVIEKDDNGLGRLSITEEV